jgi:hypothetical protein
MSQTTSGSSQEDAPIKYVCGIDVGSQSCAGCVCRPDKSVVVKPVTFANAKEGWEVLFEKLSRLDAVPNQILIGMEATSRYGENLYQEAQERGYQLCLLHPGQTHQFHRQQGLRAKTDRLDARTIAKVLLSGEARAGYVPSEQITTYRELVRLHTRLSDEAASYQNEIQILVVVLFPEFTRVFADPCLPSALAVRNRLPQRSRRCGSRGGGDYPAVANPDVRALWSSDSEKAGGIGSEQREQQSSPEWTLNQPADPVRSTRAYASQSGSLASRTGATDGPRSRSQGLGADPGVWPQNRSGPACRTRGHESL